MAQLSFTQTANGYWVAAATVNDNFALHLERVTRGTISINVSSVENAAYKEKYNISADTVYDQDFQMLIYPKYLSIVSSSEPTSGYILDGTEESSDTTETTEETTETTEENNEVEGEGE